MSYSQSGGDIWHHLRPMGGEGQVGGVCLEWGVASDVGLSRRVNEDAVLAELPVFVVADGMGGHDAGDVASSLAIDRFRCLIGSPTTVDDVTVALDSANEQIVERGSDSDSTRPMGTTAAGLALVEQYDRLRWLVFNVGDSRVYRFADHRLVQLSVDHSYVQELVDGGQLTGDAARSHPQRNVVTRALGIESVADADLWLRDPVAGERFLVCSDGLSSEVEDDAIARCLSSRSPRDAASCLIGAALASGGRDNVSVVVLDVTAAPGPSSDDSSCRADGRAAPPADGGAAPDDTDTTTDGAPRWD